MLAERDKRSEALEALRGCETDGDTIAKLMREFLGRHVAKN